MVEKLWTPGGSTVSATGANAPSDPLLTNAHAELLQDAPLEQALPQRPQLARSVVEVTSQPSARLVPLQSRYPDTHWPPASQDPAVHTAAMLLEEQAWEQAPQCASSVASSRHVPLQAD